MSKTIPKTKQLYRGVYKVPNGYLVKWGHYRNGKARFSVIHKGQRIQNIQSLYKSMVRLADPPLQKPLCWILPVELIKNSEKEEP